MADEKIVVEEKGTCKDCIHYEEKGHHYIPKKHGCGIKLYCDINCFPGFCNKRCPKYKAK